MVVNPLPENPSASLLVCFPDAYANQKTTQSKNYPCFFCGKTVINAKGRHPFPWDDGLLCALALALVVTRSFEAKLRPPE
jgi:hypothetical protein